MDNIHPVIKDALTPHVKPIDKHSWFPDYYTIDNSGLDSLNYFLLDEFAGKTVEIQVKEEASHEK